MAGSLGHWENLYISSLRSLVSTGDRSIAAMVVFDRQLAVLQHRDDACWLDIVVRS